MRKTTLLLALLLTSVLLLVPCTTPAFAWTDPILVTPDTATSRYSCVVFDAEGDLHFFFANDRYGGGNDDYDLFHCKFSRSGERLTEDLRLSNTHTYAPYPSALLGSDNKIHAVWEDELNAVGSTPPGIYYARLNADGSIDREATLIFENDDLIHPFLFQDSDSNLNAVWLESSDYLYYGKFDTSGQVLIPQMIIYSYPSYNLYNLEACMDNLDQIHCTYRNYWGTGFEWNLGYTRVNSQGEVLIEYAPLTPEITGTLCGRGAIAADDDNNLHLAYLLDENSEALDRYRKMDQNLETIYDLLLENTPLAGSNIGDAEIESSSRGYIVMIMAYNIPSIDFEYRSYCYSADGVPLSEPEVVYSNDDQYHPDLIIDGDDFWAFTCSGSMPDYEEGGILYIYQDHHLAMPSVPPLSIPRDFQVSVYPNPTNSTATLSILNPQGGDVHVQVIDVAGRLVFDYGEFFLQGKRNIILEKQISSGVYYVVAYTCQQLNISPIIHLK